MFRHFLVPTDGSLLSQNAVRYAVTLARSTGARITAFHARPECRAMYYEGGVFARHPMADDFSRLAEAASVKALDYVETLCLDSGVSCTRLTEISDFPYKAIIDAATRDGCDLIIMASHGGGGFSGLLLGSETNKVLSHSKIPVLVWR